MTVAPRPPSPPALASEVCLGLEIRAPDAAELARYLGYPAGAVPPPRIAGDVSRALERAAGSLAPRGAYALYDVGAATPHSLDLRGLAIRGQVGRFVGHAGRVAVFVVTAGEAISGLAAEAADGGDVLAAWVFDAFGSWAAEVTADALMARVAVHLAPGEALTLRYSPGYCGMAMTQQRALFALVDAAAAGVTLLPSLLMQPMKSVSGLVGLAPSESVAAYRSPCDTCRRIGCYMRR